MTSLWILSFLVWDNVFSAELALGSRFNAELAVFDGDKFYNKPLKRAAISSSRDFLVDLNFTTKEIIQMEWNVEPFKSWSILLSKGCSVVCQLIFQFGYFVNVSFRHDFLIPSFDGIFQWTVLRFKLVSKLSRRLAWCSDTTFAYKAIC